MEVKIETCSVHRGRQLAVEQVTSLQHFYICICRGMSTREKKKHIVSPQTTNKMCEVTQAVSAGSPCCTFLQDAGSKV